MFLGYQENKIVLAAATKEELEKVPCMKFDRVEETSEKYTLYEGKYLLEKEVQSLQAAAEKAAQKARLQAQMDELDFKTIRALRAMSAGVGTQEDKAKLEEFETQAAALRVQLKDLTV